MNASYTEFLNRKAQVGTATGFDPLWMPDCLFGFQVVPAAWSIRRGRAAILADCGLGKSLLELVWAENVIRHINRPVLLLTPLGVAAQMVREGEKFGVECVRSANGKFPPGARVVITNYERLCHFDPADFAGAVCDEAGVIKDFDGSRRAEVTEFLRTLPYRLLATATPAPNDHIELGTHSEALGELGRMDMIARFFVKLVKKDFRGWGRVKYRLRSYAVRDFWRWVASWARAFRKPSDLGFEDGDFLLPELVTREHAVRPDQARKGFLFDVPAMTLQEEQEEQRRTIPQRCAKVAELVAHDQPAVVWCHLNDEADLCERLIPGAVQVAGSDPVEVKEERLLAFQQGQIRVLVSKPRVAGFGLNWQHCAHQTYFPSHSFEQWYQAVRRSWRFGQKRPVVVDTVTTEGRSEVLANLRRKQGAAERMFAELVRLMNESLRVERSAYGSRQEEVPSWL
jgi:hypothetical protein